MDFGKYIAHRGLHSEFVPENSLTAFRLAVEKCLCALNGQGYGVGLFFGRPREFVYFIQT